MAKATKGPNEGSKTKVITGKVRFSYVHVHEPVAMANGGGEKKYSVSLIIPKTDADTLGKIKAAIQAAQEEGKDGKWGGKIPVNLKLPLRDGDTERTENPEYAGAFFISASTKTKPGLVDANREPITVESEFYSGCYGRASINFYPFNQNGNKGIACGLNHLQLLEKGEPLGGRGSAEEDFSDDEMAS